MDFKTVMSIIGGLFSATVVIGCIIGAWVWAEDFIGKVKNYHIGELHAERATRAEKKNEELTLQIEDLNKEIECLKQGKPYR